MRKLLVSSFLSLVLVACGSAATTTSTTAPTAAMMEAKPTDGAMMEAKPTDGAMMEAKPTDGAMMEAKPTDGAMMEAKPTDGAMMEAKPTDGAMMQAKPTDGAMMEVKPTDGAMMAEPLPANARVIPLKYIAGLSNTGPRDATGTLTLVPDSNTIIVDVKGLPPMAGKVYEIQLLPSADSGGHFTTASDGSAHFVMKIAKDLKMYNQVVLAIASESGGASMPDGEHSLASEKF